MRRTLLTFTLLFTCLLWTTSSYAQRGLRCRIDPKCGGIGGGDGSDQIISNWPGEGNMIKEIVDLKWDEVEGAVNYTVSIKDRSNILSSVIVFSKTTEMTSISLNLNQTQLELNKEYQLSISSDNGIKGGVSKFTLKPAQDYFSDLASYHATNDVSLLSEVDARLKLANFLAEKEWNYAAVKEHHLGEKMDYIDLKKTVDNLWALIKKWEPLPGDE